MPTYSSNRPGSYTVTIPEYSVNIRLSIAGAAGGDSANPTWGYARGGFGRAGDFRLKTRSYSYDLIFYIGSRGATKYDGNIPGGAGGWSPIASGGTGYRSGGGGGGASGVYDSGLGRYTIIVGGGGGSGRYADTGYSGYFSAGRGIGGGSTTSNFYGRNGQNASAGHRGGGGGGSSFGGAGSLGGAQTYNGYAGIGGNSSFYANETYYSWTTNSGYANYGDGYYTVSFDYQAPQILYFTATPSQIVLGNSTTLDWNSAGQVNTTNITPDVGNVSRQGSTTVSPTQDTTYTLNVIGLGGQSSISRVVDVLIPPTVNFYSLATNDTIIQGESTYLEWQTLGDASTASLSPGYGIVNINGQQLVSPSQTTTYTLVASHPIAGNGSAEVTITVILPPSVTINGPISVNYGDNITLSIEATNATESLTLLAKYYYVDNTFTEYELIQELPVGEYFNGEIIVAPPYNNIGPRSIEYQVTAIGEGGLLSEDTTPVSINIDQTPDYIDVPESEDKLKNEDPVITPDEDVFLTLTVDDIDIPVEVKSDFPVQMEIDDSGVYIPIREI